MKKSTIKGFLAGAVTAAILTASFSSFASSFEKQIKIAFNDIKVNIGGKVIELKDASGNTIEPFTYNGTTYLPVRAISQALSKTIAWDATTKTITISSEAGQNFNSSNRPNGTDMNYKLKTALATLVTKGTITQDQSDKISTYFDANTPSQSQGTNTERVDPLSKAVTDGVITQEQADAIKSAVMPEMNKGSSN